MLCIGLKFGANLDLCILFIRKVASWYRVLYFIIVSCPTKKQVNFVASPFANYLILFH